MAQVLTIYNPTSGSVAYMSRDCRLTVPAGQSEHDLSEAAAERLTAFLKKHHPLLKVETKSVSLAATNKGDADGATDKEDDAPAKAKTTQRRKTTKQTAASTPDDDSEAGNK